MGVLNETMTVPCSPDRAVLAIQDVCDQNHWSVLELTSTMIVCKPTINEMHSIMIPTLRVKISEGSHSGETLLELAMKYALGSSKKIVTGLLGRVTNAISIRVQTESIAINPTVAIGQGQGVDSGAPSAAKRTRVEELKDLKELFDSGVLSEEEFAAEKARILSDG